MCVYIYIHTRIYLATTCNKGSLNPVKPLAAGNVPVPSVPAQCPAVLPAASRSVVNFNLLVFVLSRTDKEIRLFPLLQKPIWMKQTEFN